MYYLISNDLNLKEDKINSLDIKDNDTVVLFNHAKPLNFKKIKDHTHKTIFLRKNINSYHGIELLQTDTYEEIILINIHNNIIEHNFLYKILLEPDIKNILKNKFDYKTKNKSFSSGFIAFIYYYCFCSINNICLINFNAGSSVEGKLPWREHDYDFEQKFYRDYNICML